MEKIEIFDKLKEIVASVKDIDVKELDFLTEDSTIKEDLGLNSIGVLYVVVAIEKQFDVDMRDADVNNFVKVGDVVDFVYDNL